MSDLILSTTESAAMLDARRAMEVCNACRYCEGLCAVFPAMELRREFTQGDLNYLANLCHSCRGCYYACQYAPPHEFDINVPRAMAELRVESYAETAWPAPLAKLYRSNGLTMSLAMAGGIALVLLLCALLQRHAVLFGAQPTTPGQGFYNVIPYGAMVSVASVTFLFSLLALFIGFMRFWRQIGGRWTDFFKLGAVIRALWDAATLRYLGGDGDGCNDHSERFTQTRRHLHHAMAYGFLLCFAATAVATIYDHFLHWPAPYQLTSLPVLFGILGGIGMIAGTCGLLWLKIVGDSEPQSTKLYGTDVGLLGLLLLIAVSGLLLLALRGTEAMGVVLCVHLGLVLGFFVTIPYGKLVHAPYRIGALIRHHIERRNGVSR